MRFKKGSKVEVFKSELPSGAWHCAEIISGNGHNYTIIYVHYPGTRCEMELERVPRKAIRPHPPHMECVNRWMAGDVVEVFEDFSWKIATILNALNGDYYLVRFLGSSTEFQTHKDDVRLRQSWQDGEWTVIGKGSWSLGMMKFNMVSTPGFPEKIDNPLVQAGENTIDFQESHVVSARTLKRAFPFVSSCAEACTGNILKVRAIEPDGDHRQMISRNPSSLTKGQCWRHACLASKGLKMVLGF